MTKLGPSSPSHCGSLSTSLVVRDNFFASLECSRCKQLHFGCAHRRKWAQGLPPPPSRLLLQCRFWAVHYLFWSLTVQDSMPSWHWVTIVQGDKQWITHFIECFVADSDDCPREPAVGLDLLISLHQRSRKDFSNSWQCWQFLRSLPKSVDGCGSFSNGMQGLTGRCPGQSRYLALRLWRCSP